MKNPATLFQTLLVVGFSFLAMPLFAGAANSTSNQQASTKNTTAVISTVQATKGTSPTLCKTAMYHGKLIPMVQMTSVNICFSNKNKKSVSRVQAVTAPSKLYPAVKYKGSYIASVELKEVSIEVSRSALSMVNTTDNNSSNSGLNVSVRKSFDHILDYAIELGRYYAAKLIPSIGR